MYYINTVPLKQILDGLKKCNIFKSLNLAIIKVDGTTAEFENALSALLLESNSWEPTNIQVEVEGYA